MAYLDRRVTDPGRGEVLCNLSLAGLADCGDGRFILDQAALVDALFSGAPLRAKFTGNRFQALALARQMLAARDLYRALEMALAELEDSHGAEPEVLAEVRAALALANGEEDS